VFCNLLWLPEFVGVLFGVMHTVTYCNGHSQVIPLAGCVQKEMRRDCVPVWLQESLHNKAKKMRMSRERRILIIINHNDIVVIVMVIRPGASMCDPA